MKAEPQRTETYFGHDRRTIERFPGTAREAAILRELALKAAGQEIGALYNLLRHKGIPGAPRLS